MGWNGSGQGGSIPQKPKVTPKKPSPVRGIVAGAVVVVLACVAYFAFFSGDEKPQKETVEKERGRIKEVKPAAAPTNVQAAVVEKDLKWKYEDGRKLPIDAYKDEKGIWRHPGGQRVFDETAPECRPTHVKELFKHYSENMIGGLVGARPGSTFAGTVRYNSPAFMEDFIESCKEPVELLETDTPRERALKLEVEKAKQELLERFRKGEDIAAILTQTRKELQKLGEVKRLMKEEVRKALADDSLTDAEVGDYINAANQLLESKGASPLRMNPVTVANIRYHFKRDSQSGAENKINVQGNSEEK